MTYIELYDKTFEDGVMVMDAPWSTYVTSMCTKYDEVNDDHTFT